MVELPSGKEVEIRKMKLSDEDVITDMSLAKDGSNIDRLLENVTGLKEEELDKFLIGDRVFILIRLRSISKGKDYYPRITCPVCRMRFEAEIDLEKLEIRKLDMSKLDDKLQFDVLLPVCKKKLVARLLTGKNEKTIRKLRKEHPKSLMSYLMMLRTVSIDGEKIKKIDWFRELDIEDSDYFREQHEDRDCGVNTTTEQICPSCMSSFDTEIPFDAAFFLQPRRTKKR